jgi:ectoine hydroxylase-related dioxygenase (phytanoyl-CoA dioxygenase family)
MKESVLTETTTFSQAIPTDDDPDEIRSLWEHHGLVKLTGVLDAEQLASMRAAIDRLAVAEWERGAPQPDFPDDYPHSVRLTSLVAQDSAFHDLIDQPRVMNALKAVMGPDILLAGSEAIVRRNNELPMSRFHTDFGPSVQRIALRPDSKALMLKVQYFLTDVTEEDQGNFIYIPGSHLRDAGQNHANCHIDSANTALDTGTWPSDAIQVRAKAGDAVFFGSQLWHGASANPRGPERQTVILRYAQLWCRSHDHSDRAAAHGTLTERQRRVLGVLPEGTSSVFYYKARDQDSVVWGG